MIDGDKLVGQEAADRASSDNLPTIMVSSMLTPMVIRLCSAMGSASANTLR